MRFTFKFLFDIAYAAGAAIIILATLGAVLGCIAILSCKDMYRKYNEQI